MSEQTKGPAERAAEKKEALESALSKGRVQVRLDPRRAGVQVPDDFAAEEMLALNLSWRFAHTDMVVNERGVAATLRFGGRPSRCVIPWSALFALIPIDGEPLLWAEDLPVEFGGPVRPEEEEEPPPVEFSRPRLSVVASNEPPPAPVAEEAPAEEPPPPEPPPAPRAPWLKLVQ